MSKQPYGPPGQAPPGQRQYAQPPGPPPGQMQYAQPPGPPPGWTPSASGPGPAPGPSGIPSEPPPAYEYAQAPPNQQHNWENAVPDTSLFPPPPAIFTGFYNSPTSNATEEEANAGEIWCKQYPLTQPLVLDDAGKGAIYYNNFGLMEPTGFNGKTEWKAPGHWKVNTRKKSPDRCLTSYPPLYVVTEHDPMRRGVPKTVYYEVRLARDSPGNTVALGYSALPYPGFRLPGWHRGSLAVHGDDGHKYVNDLWGGKKFTEEFRRGETYGIGITLKPAPGRGKPLVDIFFTRNGQLTGGWNLHEETDSIEDGPVRGLEGMNDLCASIGTYEAVDIEVLFEPSTWMYKGLFG